MGTPGARSGAGLGRLPAVPEAIALWNEIVGREDSIPVTLPPGRLEGNRGSGWNPRCLPGAVILVCPGCGRRLPEDIASCPSCGAGLSAQPVAIEDVWSEADLPGPDPVGSPRAPLRPRLLIAPAMLVVLVVLVFPVRRLANDRTPSSLASQWSAAQSLDDQRMAQENALNPFPSPGPVATANPAPALADLARLAGAEEANLAGLRTHLSRPLPFDSFGSRLRSAMEVALQGRQDYLAQLRAFDLGLVTQPSLANEPLLDAATLGAQQDIAGWLSARNLSHMKPAAGYGLSFRPAPLVRRQKGSDDLVLAGNQAPLLLDLSAGTMTSLSGPGLGAYPDQFNSVLSVGGDVIGITSEEVAVAFRPGPDPKVDSLGPADEVFASTTPDSVWVYRAGITSAQLVRVGLDGAEAPTVSLPFADRVLAVTSSGVLVDVATATASPSLEVWDPSTRAWVDNLGPMAQFVAAGGDTVAWTTPAGDLDTAELASGAHRTIDPPAGTDGFLSAGGAVSPDGTQLAAFLDLSGSPYGDRSASVVQVVTVDLDDGALSRVSSSEVVTSSAQAAACWDPTGQWLYFSGDAGSLASVDTHTGRVEDLDYPPGQQCVVLPRNPAGG